MAGARDLKLELWDGTNRFSFDYDGRLQISQEYQYNESPNPPDLRQIVERWTVTAARISGTSAENLWDKWQTFLAHTEDGHTTPITLARLIRDPDGTPVTERTLGPPTNEGFRIESIVFGDDPIPQLAPAEFRSIVPVTIVMAAFREFPDSTGIAAFEQTVRNTYSRAGLHTLEWETSISTAEGASTSAFTLGQTYAAIPISDYGNGYVWDTNSDYGFDWEELDADTRTTPDKTATKLRFVSRIRQLGISPGTPTAGESLGDANKITTVEYEGGVERTTIEATAEGPGALTYVKSLRPGGLLKSWFTRHEEGTRLAAARYVKEETPAGTTRKEISVQIRGGAPDWEFVPVSGGFAPKMTEGPLRAVRADVVIRITMEGLQPTRQQMSFPAELAEPWFLQRNVSREDALPRLAKAGVDKGADSWVREAHLVYQAAGATGENVVNPSDFDILYVDEPSVPGYFLE